MKQIYKRKTADFKWGRGVYRKRRFLRQTNKPVRSEQVAASKGFSETQGLLRYREGGLDGLEVCECLLPLLQAPGPVGGSQQGHDMCDLPDIPSRSA